MAKDGAFVLPAPEPGADDAMFAPLVVCDAEESPPDADGRAAGCDVRIAVGDVAIHLAADTPAGRIAEIVRALGVHA